MHSIHNLNIKSPDLKKEASGLLLISIGIILMLAALSLILFNQWDNHRAGKTSEATLRILEKEIDKMNSSDPETETLPETTDSDSDSDSITDPDLISMTTVRVNGYDCVGILEIPNLGIRLPVLAEWDYKRLKTAPCLYSGNWHDDSMVICGHNYQRHFAPIKSIQTGADVYFETVSGQVLHYVVTRRETVTPTAISAMVENHSKTGENESKNDWDLTLFTCHTGGRTRCAVRCARTLKETLNHSELQH